MFLENRIKINFFYYLFSIFTIIFILTYGDLNNFEDAKYQLIFFILIFIFSIFIENYRNNIFLKILIFHVFIFYILRISISIIYFDGQFFDSRGVVDTQIKKSLFDLSIQYLSLYISILIINPSFSSTKFTKDNHDLAIINFLLQLTLLIMFFNFIFNKFGSIDYNSHLKYLAVFFNIFNSKRLSIIFTTLIFLVIYKKFKVKYFYIQIFIFYGLYIIDTIILAGSRSSILHILLTVFLLFLYYCNLSRLSLRQIFYIILIIPLIQATFFLSTLYKIITNVGIQSDWTIEERIQRDAENIPSVIGVIRNMLSDWQSAVVRGVSERMAYIDFYIEKLSNKTMYESVINFSYYIKSSIDRITPGIDFFNVPFATKALQESYSTSAFIAGYLDKPWKINITNSEQITIFAETQILFSYFSPIFYLIFFFIIKYLLKSLENYKNIYYQIVSLFILILFFDWITCFGFDFFLVQSFYSLFFLTVIILISKVYLIIKK